MFPTSRTMAAVRHLEPAEEPSRLRCIIRSIGASRTAL